MAIPIPQFLIYAWGVHYLRALIIFVLSYIAMQILLFVFEKIFLQLTKKTETDIDDIIVEKTKLPFAFLVMVIGARFASESLQFDPAVNLIIERVISSAIILIGAHISSVIVHVLINHWANNKVLKTKGKLDDDLLVMFHRIDKVIVYILAFIWILHIWGVQVGPLIASLGIAGIAIAFALQSTLGNIFGGVAIIMDKAVRIGDIVEFDDGTSGEVVKVSLRSTKVRTWDNDLITIPNGKFADSRIKNWNLPDMKERAKVKFSVEYGSDIAQVKKIVLDLIANDNGILTDPAPAVIFDEMGEFALNFTAYFWISDVRDKLKSKDRLATAIYNALNEHKINIPFPTRTIIMRKE
jgi:MscS family membrane protein